jgi:hypothetical protein
MSGNDYREHIQNLSADPDFDRNAKTKIPCEYLNHHGDEWAVVRVKVDVSQCCNQLENEELALCWTCAVYGYNSQFYCKCGGENSLHKADDLSFRGEIKKVKTS